MSTQLQKQSASLDWIAVMKNRVRESRLRALMLVNAELLSLYWDIGREIISRQKQQGWGKKVIPQLSRELQSEFPDMQGFSTRNLGYMKRFAEEWSREEILQQPVAKLAWNQHITLLDKISRREDRLAYAQLSSDQGWSRATLVREIAGNAIANFGRSSNNFVQTMPQMDAEQAIAAIRDKYNLEFIRVNQRAKENTIRKSLVEKVARFMLELGAGFTYAGQEQPLNVGGDEFRMDLLFYNVRIHRYFVIEIKTRKFRPQDIGQLGFYLTAVDEQVRNKDIEGETVGILLCKSRNRVVVEYALKNVRQPIAVSTYELEQMGLPSVQALTNGLAKAMGADVPTPQ